MKKIELILNENSFKKIAFYTLVTRFDEYNEMVESAKKVGFDRDDVEFYYFDNKNSNEFDGYSGINHAIKTSDAEYVVFCHQDILFEYDNYDHLMLCIDELNNIDDKWAIAGNAGKTDKGKVRMKITDPHGPEQTFGPFPSKVISLDENFLIFNNKYNLSCTTSLKGFHLYGLDACTNARNLGLNCYVIDFHLHHKSAGNMDNSFYLGVNDLIEVIASRKKEIYYSTTCSSFFVTTSLIFNKFLNLSLIRRILTKIIESK